MSQDAGPVSYTHLDVYKRQAQDIFRDDRQGIAQDVRTIIQSTLDEYGAGVAVNAISIEDADGNTVELMEDAAS